MKTWKSVWVSRKRRCRWKRLRHKIPRKNLFLTYFFLDRELTLVYRPRIGLRPVRLVVGRGADRVEYAFPCVGRKKMKRKTNPVNKLEGQITHLAAMETTCFDRLANIVAHCAVCKYDDGGPRQPGMVMIKTLGASWVVVLKDADAGLQMQCLGATLDDALALAELHLGSEEAPWETDPWAQKKKAERNSKK